MLSVENRKLKVVGVVSMATAMAEEFPASLHHQPRSFVVF